MVFRQARLTVSLSFDDMISLMILFTDVAHKTSDILAPDVSIFAPVSVYVFTVWLVHLKRLY